MSRELLQRVHTFLCEFSGGSVEMQEADTLLNLIAGELAKPELQPVAWMTPGGSFTTDGEAAQRWNEIIHEKYRPVFFADGV